MSGNGISSFNVHWPIIWRWRLDISETAHTTWRTTVRRITPPLDPERCKPGEGALGLHRSGSRGGVILRTVVLHVVCAVSDISNLQRQIIGQCTLNDEIPLPDIGRLAVSVQPVDVGWR